MRMKQVVSLLGFSSLTTYATALNLQPLRINIVRSRWLVLKYH
ncbi:hypothetical protein PMI18_05046 [Pseudomonas sp. GM102]|nr:hypothetical protein PMI18_05046 [Pseudomonas sp. GM102]